MKGKRRHFVPSSNWAMQVAEDARDIYGSLSNFVFPSVSQTKSISNMAFLMTMRRMKVAAVPRGFRSRFRDWASEQTAFPHEVCEIEMALAHANRNKTEAAYKHGDLLNKRRDLMQAWPSTCVQRSSRSEAER